MLQWGAYFVLRERFSIKELTADLLMTLSANMGRGDPNGDAYFHGSTGKKPMGCQWTSGESASTRSLQEFAEIAVFLGGQPHIPWCKASKFSSWCHVRYDLLRIPYYASPTNQIMLQYALNWGWNPSKHVWCLLTSSCFEVNQKTTMKIFTTRHLKRNRLSAKIITPRVRTVTNIINQIPAGRPHLQLWGCQASSSP